MTAEQRPGAGLALTEKVWFSLDWDDFSACVGRICKDKVADPSRRTGVNLSVCDSSERRGESDVVRVIVRLLLRFNLTHKSEGTPSV